MKIARYTHAGTASVIAVAAAGGRRQCDVQRDPPFGQPESSAAQGRYRALGGEYGDKWNPRLRYLHQDGSGAKDQGSRQYLSQDRNDQRERAPVQAQNPQHGFPNLIRVFPKITNFIENSWKDMAL